MLTLDRLTEKGQHEDSIVPNSKLISVTEIISGREFLSLDTDTQTKCTYDFG